MTTDYLEEVLRIAPSTWTGTTYNSTNYATVQLEDDSDEYADLVQALQDKNTTYGNGISKIERVQHPFAYGRFVLRQEQLKKRHGTGQEAMRYFIQINQTDIKEALDYNLDQRRTPYMSWFDSSRAKGTCIVVVKSLQHPAHLDRDSEMYPEYVVYYDE